MTIIKGVMACIVVVTVALAVRAAGAAVETPMFRDDVAQGKLPPVAERLPVEPRVVTLKGPGRTLGRHGGEWRWLIRAERDVRMMVVFGYARLVGYDESFDLVPDILADIQVEGDRIFTLKLRKGHKWSDGAPFTSEDFRYFWEDVATHPDLSPSGPSNLLLVDGEQPRVEILDEVTVRYSWSKPNPFFLPSLAGASPLYIYMPAHYLKQFHERYADAAELKVKVRKARRHNWAALHHAFDSMYKFDNPELPTLQPWRITNRAPTTRFVAVRNPYFHRVDTKGQQLPYIDSVVMDVTDGKLVPVKTGAGDAQLQARGLYFNNVTFLKAGEERNGYKVRLWRTAKGSNIALFPNLNHEDPLWRALFRDVRFRRALSLAIDRSAINQAVFFGLANESNNTVLAQSPLYREPYQKTWATYDIKKANALLDEIGLTERGSDGVRLLSDGRPLEIIVETAGEDIEQVDVLELVRETWAKAGVKLFIKPSQREVFRNRIFAGQTQVSVWTGLENGVPVADMAPAELAPTSQHQYQWPMWGQHYQTGGRSGEVVDMAPAQALARLNTAWLKADSRDERAEIWHKMLEIHAEQVFSIGLINGVLQPVVVGAHMRNVPEEGIYNWDPGAFFGMYLPDTFWLDK